MNSYLALCTDISATHILMSVIHISGWGTKKVSRLASTQYEAEKVKSVKDFYAMVEDIMAQAKTDRKKIRRIVLSPAGAVMANQTATVTNRGFMLDVKEMKKELFPHAAIILINDFTAIGYAVAGAYEKLSVLALRPEKKKNGTFANHAAMGIMGAGTGLGMVRLFYDTSKKTYFVQASEGGHARLMIDPLDTTECEIGAYLAGLHSGRHPELEDVLCGRGIVHLFEYFHAKNPDAIDKLGLAKEYEDALDKAAYITTCAKQHPKSVFVDAMRFFWRSYGRALRDLAVHEVAQGGIFITGGIARKNMIDTDKIDENILKLILDEFDNSALTHSKWVSKIPLYLIRNEDVGLIGAEAVAGNEMYFDREMRGD